MSERSESLRVAVPGRPSLTPADVLGQFEPLRGRAVVLANADGSHWGFRAWGEVRIEGGFPVLDVVPERNWWVHVINRRDPHASLVRAWPAGAAFVLSEG